MENQEPQIFQSLDHYGLPFLSVKSIEYFNKNENVTLRLAWERSSLFATSVIWNKVAVAKLVKGDHVDGKVNVSRKRVGLKGVNALYFREILEVLQSLIKLADK